MWLQAEYTSRYLAGNPEPTEHTAGDVLALANIDFIEITHRGALDDMVVRARISVEGSVPRYGNAIRYFLMEYSLVTGWSYRHEVTKWSYYLNIF